MSPLLIVAFFFIMPVQHTPAIEYVDYKISVDIEDPSWPIFEGWETRSRAVITNVGLRPLNFTSTITILKDDLKYEYKFTSVVINPNEKLEIPSDKFKVGPSGTYSVFVSIESNEKIPEFPVYNRLWINDILADVPSSAHVNEIFYVYPILSLITAISIGVGSFVPSIIYVLNLQREHQREARNQPSLSIIFDSVNNPDYFTPILGFTGPQGQPTNITRRFIRIIIRNDGRETAELCKASARVVRRPNSCNSLSGEPKTLRWEMGNVYQDIYSRGGEEPLHVVFSDIRSPIGPIPTIRCSQQTGDASLYAWISTPDGIQNMSVFRNQDGLCLGDFEVEVTVRPKRGQPTSGIFRITVTPNWTQLNMSRIS